VAPSRKLLLAIAAGVVIAAPPVAGFNIWLNSLAERQSLEDLNLSAQRSLMLAERRIAAVVATLDALAARNVDSCRSQHLEALRQATFFTMPVKELSVIAPDGRTLCSDVGSLIEPRYVVSSEKLSPNSEVLLEVVRLGDRPERIVRLRRPGNWGANSLAAMIPAELLTSSVSSAAGPAGVYTRMTTRSGQLIREFGPPPAPNAKREDRFSTSRPSDRYALDVAVSMPREKPSLSQGDLRAIGTLISALLAFLILGLTYLLPKRSRGNPVAELERALAAGEFVPYYQPIVDISSGRLRGAEVLMRWRKPDGTVVSPAAFIPLAESSGLIVEMTRALMQRVCDEAGTELVRRPHLRVSFNLTAAHFSNEDIVEDVRRIFQNSKIRLSQVVLEVTERQPLENLTETRRIVAALQGLGVRVAIDDVGTGHSGLSYMLKLGVDVIKIDKMFIDALGTDRNSNAIVETLIDLAKSIRMEIIAEGVESFEQVVQLRELGVRAAQGYVFAPPLPGSAFLQLVEAIDPIKTAVPDAATRPEQFPAIQSNAA
jgi:sensor c-di-GMP phosphodiesterase-like protein